MHEKRMLLASFYPDLVIPIVVRTDTDVVPRVFLSDMENGVERVIEMIFHLVQTEINNVLEPCEIAVV